MLRLAITELVIVALGVGLIAGGYVWLIPTFYPGHRTYSVLVLGLALVATASGWVASEAASGLRMSRWLLVFGACGSVTFATFAISLFVILNKLGS